MQNKFLNSLKKNYIFISLCLVAGWAILQYCGTPHLKDHEEQGANLISINKKEVTFTLEQLLASPGYIQQNNELMIQEIREKYIKPPSRNNYTLNNPQFSETWQSQAVKKMLGNKTKGYFIECGANDGEQLSNTLPFEINDDWDGLLIEADPVMHASLLKKNRKSLSVNACLSPKPYPQKVNFHQQSVLGKIVREDLKDKKDNVISLQCFPLYSILLATNRTQVDFFSLDVEGFELEVLRTIPWKDVQISIFTVEFNNIPEGKEAVRKYMEEVGYVMHIDGQTVANAGGQNIDYIFYHPQLVNITK